ncbi:MAG: pseudouridine synthase [Gammaproteobacteria bacterium]|nr:pseudouridine synthase [Gammaproteobacteria bacterium]MCY4218704.1 pseudouridine synthase [Gammaproteobacteria bacterium]MCY4275001.1 pseudouridine synthase [Gammaproteobacteria bacterium]
MSNQSSEEPIRLSKLMSMRGICSRREADKYIALGLVQVDGEVITTLGYKVDHDQQVELSPNAKLQQDQLITVLLNKPPGFVSGQPEKGYQSAITLITRTNAIDPNIPVPKRKGLAPAGRLDIDSSGLMVYTEDGRIAKQLIGEHSQIEKEYAIRVKGEIKNHQIQSLSTGIELDGRHLKRASIQQISPQRLIFILKEGRKRQIRRMCETVGLTVVTLVRTRIGNVKLADLPRGKWRLLDDQEYF